MPVGTAVSCPEQRSQHLAWQCGPAGFSQRCCRCMWSRTEWMQSVASRKMRKASHLHRTEGTKQVKIASTSALLSCDDTARATCNMMHATLYPVTLGSLVRWLACLSTKAAINTPSSLGGVSACTGVACTYRSMPSTSVNRSRDLLCGEIT